MERYILIKTLSGRWVTYDMNKKELCEISERPTPASSNAVEFDRYARELTHFLCPLEGRTAYDKHQEIDVVAVRDGKIVVSEWNSSLLAQCRREDWIEKGVATIHKVTW